MDKQFYEAEQQSRRLNSLPYVSVIGILIGVGILLYFLHRIEQDALKADADKVNAALTHQKELSSIIQLQYDHQIKLLTDSVETLNVEKGKVEIELNRSNANIKRLSNNYGKAKEVHDTVAALSNCDSMIDENLILAGNLYWYRKVNDSLVRKIGKVVSTQDTARNVLKTEVIVTDNTNRELKDENKILKEKVKKKNKLPVISAVVGFVAGILVMVFN